MTLKEYEKQKLIATNNDNLIKNLKATNQSHNLKEIMEKLEKAKQEEILQIEQRYQGLLAEKDIQHKEFLEEIDQLMLEQENEINEIKQKNDELTIQLHQLQVENQELKEVINMQKDAENLKRKLPDPSDYMNRSEDLLVYLMI